MNRPIGIILPIIMLYILFFESNCFAAQKIAQIDFDNAATTIDPYGNANISWSDVDPGTIQYVAGHSGKAARTSHNYDDGGGDLTISIGMPKSGEIYIKWWVKYEAQYWGLVGSIWNVKWLWSGAGGDENHTEHIFQYYNNGNIGLNSYQSDPNFKAFYSTTFPYTFGDWMKVEMYWKQSTGNGTNADGVFWCRVNDVIRINETSLVTGIIQGSISSPAIKASGDCETGKGWWQIDSYEAWDGMPDETPSPSTPSFTGVMTGSIR